MGHLSDSCRALLSILQTRPPLTPHRDVQPKTRVILSKQVLPTPHKLCQRSHCERQPLWRLPEVPTKSSRPSCQPPTVTVFLEVCMRCKPMSSALWVLGATTRHLPILPVLALKSHDPTIPSPRNQEIGKSCQSHIFRQIRGQASMTRG